MVTPPAAPHAARITRGAISQAEETGCSGVAAVAAALEAQDLSGLNDVALVDAVAGWEHVISAAAARQAEVIRELLARRAGREERFLADEVACALTSTRRSAENKVALACALGTFPALHDALLAGRLDTRRVTIAADELAGIPDAQAATILDRIIDDAATATGPRLRQILRRATLAIDPADTERRCDQARADRHVRIDPVSDSMAWISALLPAPDAVAVFTVIDALAGHHDPDRADDQHGRTADQRRADALTDVFTSMLGSGLGPHGPLPRRHGIRPTIHVTVAATTLLGLDDHPAELAGYGPIPAPLARSISRDGTWRRILTDPATGVLLERSTLTYRPGADLTGIVLARDVTCTFPGCRQPATRCDLDHVAPFTPTLPASIQTTEDNLHALCRHHHLAKTHTRWTVTRDPRTAITRWTSPAGITYARTPIPIGLTTDAANHQRPPAPHPATGPPF